MGFFEDLASSNIGSNLYNMYKMGEDADLKKLQTQMLQAQLGTALRKEQEAQQFREAVKNIPIYRNQAIAIPQPTAPTDTDIGGFSTGQENTPMPTTSQTVQVQKPLGDLYGEYAKAALPINPELGMPWLEKQQTHQEKESDRLIKAMDIIGKLKTSGQYGMFKQMWPALQEKFPALQGINISSVESPNGTEDILDFNGTQFVMLPDGTYHQLKRDPITEFGVFYKSKKDAGWTDDQISKDWEQSRRDRQAFVANIRIPPYQQAQNMPIGYTFNRKTGKYVSPEGKEVHPEEFLGLFTSGAEQGATRQALKDLEKRDALIGTFTTRIDSNTKVVKDLAQKYAMKAGTFDNRIMNLPVNKLAGIMGSGDWASLNLALTSLSNEIAKVESGSLGIAEVSVEQAKRMAKVHDPNMSLNDLIKVLETGKLLGHTSKQALVKQKNELKGRMSGGKQQPEPQPPPDQSTGRKWVNKNGTWVQE